MLISISIQAYTGTLCFRPIILKRLNSSELVVQTIAYLVKGRQMLQKYLANRCDNPPLATCKVLRYLTQIYKGCHSEVAMLPFRCWFWCLKVSILSNGCIFCFSSPVYELNDLCQEEQNKLAFDIR